MNHSPQSSPQAVKEPQEQPLVSAFTFRSRINPRKYSEVCKDLMNAVTTVGKPDGLLIDLADSGVPLTQDFEASMDTTNNTTSNAGTATGSSPPQHQGRWQQQQRGRRRPTANKRKHIAFQSPATNSDLESGVCLPAAPEPAIVDAEPTLPPDMNYKSSNTKVPVGNKFDPLSKYEFAPSPAEPVQEVVASMDGPEVETAPPGLPEESNGKPSILPGVPAKKKRGRGRMARTVFVLKDGMQAISDGLGVTGIKKEENGGEEWIVLPLDDGDDGNSGQASEFLNEDWLDAMEEIDREDSD